MPRPRHSERSEESHCRRTPLRPANASTAIRSLASLGMTCADARCADCRHSERSEESHRAIAVRVETGVRTATRSLALLGMTSAGEPARQTDHRFVFGDTRSQWRGFARAVAVFSTSGVGWGEPVAVGVAEAVAVSVAVGVTLGAPKTVGVGIAVAELVRGVRVGTGVSVGTGGGVS